MIDCEFPSQTIIFYIFTLFSTGRAKLAPFLRSRPRKAVEDGSSYVVLQNNGVLTSRNKNYWKICTDVLVHPLSKDGLMKPAQDIDSMYPMAECVERAYEMARVRVDKRWKAKHRQTVHEVVSPVVDSSTKKKVNPMVGTMVNHCTGSSSKEEKESSVERTPLLEDEEKLDILDEDDDDQQFVPNEPPLKKPRLE